MDWRIPLPRIRAVNPMVAVHDDRQVYYLQDPLELSETSIVIPQELGAILMLCDGTRTLKSLQTSLRSIFGIDTNLDELKQLFTALDQALLLENERYNDARAAALRAFREAPARPATHAGDSYPADPDDLAKMLASFDTIHNQSPPIETIRGLISPHIDFSRGGATYARTWNSLKPLIQDIDLAIIFGTDHQGDGELFTLTRQDYATPMGILPTFQQGIDILIECLGEQSLFSGELRHRSEHSVEFAAVWLHHLREGDPCPILPILCESEPIATDDSESVKPRSNDRLAAAMNELRTVMDTHKTLVIAAGDLSHVGPAFGGKAVDDRGLEELAELDQNYIDALERGEAFEFHNMILANQNRSNVCGTAPFIHALNLLSPATGRLIDYQQCTADLHRTSWVSICGMHLY